MLLPMHYNSMATSSLESGLPSSCREPTMMATVFVLNTFLLFGSCVFCFATDTINTTEVASDEAEVCFKKVGCFDLSSPWKSLTRPLPRPFNPADINTKVYFYTRPDVEKRFYPQLEPTVDLKDAPYNPNNPTVFITHGFASNGNASWQNDLKNAYLKHQQANVFIVDWGEGSSLLNYLQVASNTRVVGKELALLVEHLVKNKGTQLKDVHLIGHSLGAQISSYVAKDHKGIGRLTALDPAQPGFEGFNKVVRLDKTDAEFVEVVHTDARPFIPTLGFGMITPHGHSDYYVNGGFDQPGCIVPPADKLPNITSLSDLALYPVEVIGEIVACPHGRSYEYLTEAYDSNCTFWGHKASISTVTKTVTNTVTQGVLSKYVALSGDCSKDDCVPMNLDSINSHLRGIFVISTKGRSPFCISAEEEQGKLKTPAVVSNIEKGIGQGIAKGLGKIF